jgi:endonuclease-3
MELKERAVEITNILKEKYPAPKTELNYIDETQFAVDVMLSAQTTDKKVNQITAELFKKYKTWEDFANADLSTLQQDIRGVNFHLGKADRLIKAARFILTEYGGSLPRSMEDLVRIPGVARKTANVILHELWGISEGIVVDTHVARVSQRLQLTIKSDPVKIEKDLMEIIPKENWGNFSGSMVLLGRYICTARKPNCSECPLNKFCPSAFSFV